MSPNNPLDNLSRPGGTLGSSASCCVKAAPDPGKHLPTKDCAFDMEGFKNVLSLRAQIMGQCGGQAPAPEKDLGMSL